MARARWLWLGLGIGALALIGAGSLRVIEGRRLRSEVALAKSDLVAGRHYSALRRLDALARRWPGRGEVDYHIGLGEQARGRPDAALEAWRRVRLDDAPYGGWAAVHRADLELRAGRIALAEDILREAVAAPGPHQASARTDLVHQLRLQGRFAEARRLFLDGFAAGPDPVEGLRLLYHLDVDPFPADGVRAMLEAALRYHPEDDRAWLGLAHLAIRSGQLDDAARWIDACLVRRPDDPAIWGARLDWAVAAGRPDLAREALGRVEPGDESVALRLRAWFARQAGDAVAERAALERLIDIDPGAADALERLAELAIAADRRDEALALRRRKANLEPAREAYMAGLGTDDPASRASEMARLAGLLGRPFDAACWLGLAERPGRSSAELAALAEAARPKGPSWSGLVPVHVVVPTQPVVVRTTGASDFVPQFRDDARAVGLGFFHDNGHISGRLIPPESFSGGVGLIDFDGDGWLDVYAVQSGPFPPASSNPVQGDRLYRNTGDGTFEDVTEKAGIAGMPGGYGFGVAVGDVDNDGWPDLFVTRWRSYALYRNTGDGTFEDVTGPWGLTGDRDWPTSAAFADLDNDGDLDLYVCHYLAWDENDPRSCLDPKAPTRTRCNPRDFPARPDRLFRNDGGRFVDVTTEAGIDDRDGRGLGVLAADVNGDGRVDLFVANDMTANYLWMNRGGLRFDDVAHESGVAANASGGYQAGMGVTCGDLDGDGTLDLAVTNYYGESTSLFAGMGHGFFADHTASTGLAASSRDLLGFGLVAADFDADGRLDLLSANGHVHDGRPQFPWTMPAQLLAGRPGGRLEDVSPRSGPPFRALHLGRGLAAGDLDNDGRIDAVLVAQNEPLVYLHNETEPRGRFVTLRLEGTASNRDAVGASVRAIAGGRTIAARRIGGGSYLAASDARIHLGLGTAEGVDSLEVRWPSGRADRYGPLPAGRGYLLRERDPSAGPLPGWRGTDERR